MNRNYDTWYDANIESLTDDFMDDACDAIAEGIMDGEILLDRFNAYCMRRFAERSDK